MQLFANNATSTLATALASGGASVSLKAGDGAKFPTPSGGDYFELTLIGRDANGVENAWEVVKVTARSVDTLTVVRAQEGTTAVAWGVGTPLQIRTTASTLSHFAQTDDPNLILPATSTALAARVRTDTAAQGLTSTQKTNAKTNLDLQNVENKSSATIRGEITSANVTGALAFTPLDAAKVGAASGVAPLGADTKIPAAYLPSYVDDVLEYANLAGFPATGATGIIYVADDTNKTYRWSGTAYVEISASPGSTDAVTEGATNLYFTAARVLNTVLTGLSTVTNAVISATDSVVSSLGKLQAQVSARALKGANSDITSLAGLTTALSVAQGGTGATTAAAARTALGAAVNGANGDITSLTGLTTALSVGQGGTGGTTAAAARTALGTAASGANSDITALSGLATALSVAQGGTGSTTAANARAALSAAVKGANNDITSLTGLTTALSVAQGGTGAATAAAALTALGGAAKGANSDITALSGLTTALSVAQGGTGSTTAAAALTALGGAPLASPNFTTNAQISGVDIGLKDAIQNAQAAAYTLVVADRGKCVVMSAGATIPANVFAAGAVITLYNNSAAAQTITQGTSLVLRFGASAAAGGNRTLGINGICTVMFVNATTAVITGSGLT